MSTHVFKPLTIALLLGIAPLSISTAYAVAAVAGPAGPAGATGARGATGLTGAAGAKGNNGSNGTQGIQGVRGLAGTNGTTGTNGATGARGLTGATGPSGGVKGDTGAAGAIGPIGLTGPAGSAAVHVIGDSYAGGIVFWVDAAGEHGLIAARADQNAGVKWSNGGTYKLTGTTGDGLYAGAMNTMLLVAQQTGDTTDGNFAAKVAADYSVQENGTSACTGAATEICYGDWYLPSKFELKLLYQNKTAAVVGGFANNDYWSSSENGSGIAWSQYFLNGFQYNTSKLNPLPVRAVRAF